MDDDLNSIQHFPNSIIPRDFTDVDFEGLTCDEKDLFKPFNLFKLGKIYV